MIDTESLPAELVELRKSIDNIDAAMIHLLAERFRCTRQVGILKARCNLLPTDSARENTQTRRLRDLAETAGLDPKFAQAYLAFVVSEVIRQHKEILRENKAEG